MVGLLTVVGGALVGGLWTYTFFRHRERPHDQMPGKNKPACRHTISAEKILHDWSTSGGRTDATGWVSLKQDESIPPRNDEPVGSFPDFYPKLAEPHVQARTTRDPLQHEMRASSVSLGLATVGLLFFPPLQYASIPTLIYMGIPSAQDAYEKLRLEKRPSMALAETAALAVCLAGGYYWVGSLGFCLYYWGRSHFVRLPTDPGLSPESLQNGHMVHLLQDGKTVMVLADVLKPGDQVVIQTSELAPAEGIIVDGSALVLPSVWMLNRAGQVKQIGDKICAADLILVGRISVKISPPNPV